MVPPTPTPTPTPINVPLPPTLLPPPNLGTISFCDRAAFNVKSDAFKAAVVARLEAFGARILRRHVDPFVAPAAVPGQTPNAQNQNQVLRGPQMVCLRSHGNPYLLLFTRNDDGGGMLLFVDRKIQPGYTVPRVVLAHGRFDDALFDGTVVDGEMVKTRAGAWVFLANDLLALEGRPVVPSLSARLAALVAVFSDQRRTPDAELDPCAYQVKRHLPLCEEGLRTLRSMEGEIDYPTRGMLVRPAEAPPYVRARFLEYDPSLVVRRAPDCGGAADKADADFRAFPPARGPEAAQAVLAPTAPSAAPDPLPAPPSTMQLRRTALPDVYDVHDPASGLVVGAAHVPSARLSADLREAFRGVPLGGYVTRACIFREQFCKWEPLLPANHS